MAFVIPVYNHPQTLAGVVGRARALSYPIFVVDDGSGEETRQVLKGIEGVCLLHHDRNRGKGAALLTGFAAAARVADWAICLDADGQHDPQEARSLLSVLPAAGRPIVVGRRIGMDPATAPWTSRFGRKFSNFWVRTSGGPRLQDSQSGFRLYPLPEVLELPTRARRFQWEVEILVLANWVGIPVVEAGVRVTYEPKGQRISHFRPFVDFWRNFGTFSRLITQRILIPRRIRARRLAGHLGTAAAKPPATGMPS